LKKPKGILSRKLIDLVSSPLKPRYLSATHSLTNSKVKKTRAQYDGTIVTNDGKFDLYRQGINNEKKS